MIDLKKLLSEYPELLHDRKRLKGILLDLNTELADRPKINLLMSIYDLGIVNSSQDSWAEWIPLAWQKISASPPASDAPPSIAMFPE